MHVSLARQLSQTGCGSIASFSASASRAWSQDGCSLGPRFSSQGPKLGWLDIRLLMEQFFPLSPLPPPALPPSLPPLPSLLPPSPLAPTCSRHSTPVGGCELTVTTSRCSPRGSDGCDRGSLLTMKTLPAPSNTHPTAPCGQPPPYYQQHHLDKEGEQR